MAGETRRAAEGEGDGHIGIDLDLIAGRVPTNVSQ